MKRKLFSVLLLFISFAAVKAQEHGDASVSLGNMRLQFKLDADGRPQYVVFYRDKPIIQPSNMGFILDKTTRLNTGLVLTGKKERSVDENWKPIWGEQSIVRNHYNEFTVSVQQNDAPHLSLDIIFRVFEDGVAFRYEFPLQPHLKNFTVSEEQTVFKLTGDHEAFWIPGDFDSNEYLYTKSKLSEVDAWKMPMISSGDRANNIPDQYAVQTPLMIKTSDAVYINIHEAALINYPAMQLHVDSKNYSLLSRLVPDATGNKAYLRTPAVTPWRTIIISDKATDILASRMILNLNEPSNIKNTSWITPMKFMGVWEEMQVGKSSWNYTDNLDSLTSNGKLVPNGRHGANTANVKRYIDFAGKNGIKGLLVEGWNTGWEEWGADKEEKFDFVTAYPDFDINEITRYAKLHDVKLIMHNETGGSATSYERQMDTAFRLMNALGYPAVKTGYVGKIVPRGEHHDGQWMVNHYIRSIQKAAAHNIMIDIHEPVRPTGLHRTYPNFIACEAGRGNEWNFFSEGSPPNHECILPFTRLIGGPMDYTPGIFKLRGYAPAAPNRQMHSTLAKQLALYVIIYSPLQMAADMPENYEAHPDAFQFIKDVATDWDDTKIFEAEPGDYITIARKAKGTNNWFLGSITNENSRKARIQLSFLDKQRKYLATLYEDAAGANWKTNPEAYIIQRFLVTGETVLNLPLAPGGGAAVSIIPADDEQLKNIPMYKNK